MANTMFIEGREIAYEDEKNLLEVIRKAGYKLPTLCYRPDLKPFGACRMCVVEIEGRGIQSACTMPPEAGLKISVNSARVRRVRRTVLELLLANHDRECTSCGKSGNCMLQEAAEEYQIHSYRFPTRQQRGEMVAADYSSNPALIRDPNKCILCGCCVRACSEFHGEQHAILGFTNRGSKTVVQPMAGRTFGEVDCVLCGQCQQHCPTGSIGIKNDEGKVWAAINNPNVKVVAQIAPAVRMGLGELFGMPIGQNSMGKMVSAMRAIGFDLVFDTNFGADLTIMEEANEFVERFSKGGTLPLMTSCCPAWVTYVESHHPDMIPHLSSAKSPMSEQSPVMRELVPNYYKDKGYSKDNLVIVAIMPCTAKKKEILRPQLNASGKQDTDYVLTTQELARMIRSAGIDFKMLPEQEADNPYGVYTGAGAIFAASGGVIEAAARTAYEWATGEDLKNVDIEGLRGETTYCRDVEIDLKAKGKVTIRVTSTLREAEKALQEIKAGTNKFHLLEVMACPGGCVNGGGQPRSCDDANVRVVRADGIYAHDRACTIRQSHKNPEIIRLYKEYLEKPGSHRAHDMLHTHYSDQLKGSYRDVK